MKNGEQTLAGAGGRTCGSWGSVKQRITFLFSFLKGELGELSYPANAAARERWRSKILFDISLGYITTTHMSLECQLRQISTPNPKGTDKTLAVAQSIPTALHFEYTKQTTQSPEIVISCAASARSGKWQSCYYSFLWSFIRVDF